MPEGRRQRNPDWTRDELILALDLYLRRQQVDDSDPEVIELSALLNALPIHTDTSAVETFRNANSVHMKLANFAHFDPSYHGTGMSRGSHLDEEVWERFADHPDEVARLAAVIRASAGSAVVAAPQEDEDAVPEGKLIYRQHRVRERDRKLVERKKKAVIKATGRLACEACDLVFVDVYGELGENFIECHHTVPLSESGETQTMIADLALVCSNCHRMIHRSRPWPTLAQLRAIVLERRT